MIDDFRTDLVLRVAAMPRDEILKAMADQRIRRIKEYLEKEREVFQPYIWVDTGFKRRSQPLFALSVCEHQRHLDFPKGFWRLSIDRQLGRAQCCVREHVCETGGDLGIWGQIKQYWFYYKKNAAYLLARNGEVIGKHEGPVPSQIAGSRELDVISLATREAQQ